MQNAKDSDRQSGTERERNGDKDIYYYYMDRYIDSERERKTDRSGWWTEMKLKQRGRMNRGRDSKMKPKKQKGKRPRLESEKY